MSAKRVLQPSPAIHGQTLIDDWRRSGFRASHGTPALLHFPAGREENAGAPEYFSDRDNWPDFAPPRPAMRPGFMAWYCAAGYTGARRARRRPHIALATTQSGCGPTRRSAPTGGADAVLSHTRPRCVRGGTRCLCAASNTRAYRAAAGLPPPNGHSPQILAHTQRVSDNSAA